jgi:hypothetical protein
MPWQEEPTTEGPATPMSVDDLPEDMRHLLLLRPRRNPGVEWEEDDETGLVTLVYPKDFSSFERLLGKLLTPVEEIRRPLDGPGTFIWLMLDGENDIATVCTAVDDAFKEEMEPVLKRVVEFIKRLAQRGLVIVSEGSDEDQA